MYCAKRPVYFCSVLEISPKDVCCCCCFPVVQTVHGCMIRDFCMSESVQTRLRVRARCFDQSKNRHRTCFSSIHLPDGSLARTDEGSSVIYLIVKINNAPLSILNDFVKPSKKEKK